MPKFFLTVLFLCVLLAGSPPCHAEYDYIDISTPFLRKIPIAVPEFKSLNQTPQELEISLAASDQLSAALDFTGYFKLLDRAAFLADPQTAAIAGPEIQFANWTAIGAEMLITAGIALVDGTMELELRLYDTFKERLLTGKRYRGQPTDQRTIIHRFCGEIMQQLSGHQGIFNSRIAFISSGSGNKEVYIADFDGHNPQPFTSNKSINLSPAWSSDGQWIAYTSYLRGKPDLYIRHISENRGALVDRTGTNISPSWVPGKFELAASLSFSGDPEIYLLTGGGKIINVLVQSSGIDVSPSFSPDGKKMAFVSNRAGSPQIYIKNLEDGSVERLTYQGRNNTQPAWSPRGDQIAYTGLDSGLFNIYLIGTDGRGPVQITYNQRDNESPSWSPDASMLAFSSNREGGEWRIYVMTAYGTDQRRLLQLPGQQTEPAWSANRP